MYKEQRMNKDHRLRIIDLLELIKNRDYAKNDKWKVRAYDKVIKELKSRTTPITSIDDIKDIKGIGEKIRKKIEEIIDTGDLQQVHKIDNDVAIVTDLIRVFGIGPIRARELHEKHNIKSVEDLELKPELLNDKQLMGLKYYKDFERRIPRTEMEKHSRFILDTIKNIDDNTVVEIMGSYRRGTKDSGDIDVLIRQDDNAKECTDVFTTIVNNLTAHLYLVDTFAKGNKKYNGVCRLKRHKFHRRIDIMFASKETFPFALLYFTGSQQFNITLRNHALSMGYSLNEYGLKYMNGDNRGEFVKDKFESEEDVLNFLKLRYIEPTKREMVELEDYKL